jgi:decaprenylphospho-beta-D-ribofuranose 2-oxidase
MSVDTLRLDDIDALLAAMSEGDHRYRYSVAWIDLAATGRQLGRSVLTRGDHARLDQLTEAGAPLAYAPRQRLSVPPLVPRRGVINHLTVAAFNELWFRKAPRERTAELQSIATFFHPLDMVAAWNRVYGQRGFVQYQFVVPLGAEDALRNMVGLIAERHVASFLAVLKRFGPGDDAPLSFPMEGWTLALDAPLTDGLGSLVHELDRRVLAAGGRVYMAKDAHTTPAMIRACYPRLGEWQAVRDSVDPEGVWHSDLGRRLELVG